MSGGAITMDHAHADRFIRLGLHRSNQLKSEFDPGEFMTHLLDLYAWNNDIKEPKEVAQE